MATKLGLLRELALHTLNHLLHDAQRRSRRLLLAGVKMTLDRRQLTSLPRGC